MSDIGYIDAVNASQEYAESVKGKVTHSPETRVGISASANRVLPRTLNDLGDMLAAADIDFGDNAEDALAALAEILGGGGGGGGGDDEGGDENTFEYGEQLRVRWFAGTNSSDGNDMYCYSIRLGHDGSLEDRELNDVIIENGEGGINCWDLLIPSGCSLISFASHPLQSLSNEDTFIIIGTDGPDHVTEWDFDNKIAVEIDNTSEGYPTIKTPVVPHAEGKIAQLWVGFHADNNPS
jgi:hypothetical protein